MMTTTTAAPSVFSLKRALSLGVLAASIATSVSVAQAAPLAQLSQIDLVDQQGTLRLYAHTDSLISHRTVAASPERVVIDLEQVSPETTLRTNLAQAPNVDRVSIHRLSNHRVQLVIDGHQLSEPLVGFRTDEVMTVAAPVYRQALPKTAPAPAPQATTDSSLALAAPAVETASSQALPVVTPAASQPSAETAPSALALAPAPASSSLPVWLQPALDKLKHLPQSKHGLMLLVAVIGLGGALFCGLAAWALMRGDRESQGKGRNRFGLDTDALSQNTLEENRPANLEEALAAGFDRHYAKASETQPLQGIRSPLRADGGVPIGMNGLNGQLQQQGVLAHKNLGTTLPSVAKAPVVPRQQAVNQYARQNSVQNLAQSAAQKSETLLPKRSLGQNLSASLPKPAARPLPLAPALSSKSKEAQTRQQAVQNNNQRVLASRVRQQLNQSQSSNPEVMDFLRSVADLMEKNS